MTPRILVYFSLLVVAVIDTTTKSNAGNKGFTRLPHPRTEFNNERSQGRNSKQGPEAGTDAETTEQCCLLACSPELAQPSFFSTKNHFPGNGTALSGLGPPTSIINQENVP